MGSLEFGPLHADFYAFTMGEALFREGRIDAPVTFQSFIRKPPFGGSYLLVAGLNDWLDWLKDWSFDPAFIAYLAEQAYPNGKPILSPGYLKWLENTPLTISVTALPEGELAFANTPLVTISGPIGQALIAEAMLLNIVNSQSLIATYASRIRTVAGDDLLVEGGLRRAQDIGGISPTRAAYIGGFDATSNTAAGFKLGIPVRGTFAHAYVTFHETEQQAFEQYATHMPEAPSFLVDTYDTLNGVRKVISVCKAKGIEPASIRFDSGDLGWLSRESKAMLREAGFTNTKLIASNDLDATTIAALKQQQKEGNAHIDAWLVGTNLVTSREQPALGGVYKLVMEGNRPVIKVAERGATGADTKTTIPGEHTAIRYVRETALGTQWYGDTILSTKLASRLIGLGPARFGGTDYLSEEIISVNLNDPDRPKKFRKEQTFVYPYRNIMKQGKELEDRTSLTEIRRHARHNLEMLAPEHKRLNNPHHYVAGLEESLYEQRRSMVRQIYLEGQL